MKNTKPLYIVTGATGSIGMELARNIAEEGHSLVLACRNMKKAEQLRVKLKQNTGNSDILCVELDLETFSGVRKFCDEIALLSRPIAALINNAGVMTRNSSLTADGYERDFQVNTFSTILLSLLLIPMMSAGSAIVFTTSVTRNVWKLSDSFPKEEKFGQLSTYGRSKRALTMFAISLSRRLKQKNIRVMCADPGVVNTGMITMHRWFDVFADVFFRPFISSPEKGALSALTAMKRGKIGVIYYHERELQPSESIVAEADKVYEKIIEVLGEHIQGKFTF